MVKRGKWVTKLAVVTVVLVAAALLAGSTGTAWAHCDTLDGPVVKAAQHALDTGNVKLVLIWVDEAHEAELTEAFDKAMAARKAGPEAQAVADQYFFETLVRVHRAGEGAGYTGLKPAGQDLGPAVTGADQALEAGNVQPVVDLTTQAVQAGIKEHYEKVMALKDYDPSDVAAGREYVEAYVQYVHYVEGVYNAAAGAGDEHGATASGAAGDAHNAAPASPANTQHSATGAAGGDLTTGGAPTAGSTMTGAAASISTDAAVPWILAAVLAGACVTLWARLWLLQRHNGKPTTAAG